MAYKKQRLWCQNSSKSLWTTLKTKLNFCRFNTCAIFFKYLCILSLVEQKKISVPVLYLRSLIPGDISHWTPFSHAPLATSTPHRLLALFILMFFTSPVSMLHAFIFFTLYTFHSPIAASLPHSWLALFILILNAFTFIRCMYFKRHYLSYFSGCELATHHSSNL